MTENDNLVWLMTNDGYHGLQGIPPLFGDLASIYSMSYTENTIADQGTGDLYKPGVRGYQGES